MTHKKPQRRRKPKAAPETRTQAVERHQADRDRIAREVAKHDFDRRAVELRRQGKTYAEIAMAMSEERGEVVKVHVVRQHILNRLRDVEGTNELRMEELDKLESMAGRLRAQIEQMEEADPQFFDVEVYSKIVETYLKYRDRIARLMGLDQGGNNGGIQAQKAAQDAAAAAAAKAGDQHLHVHVESVEAFEQWQRLHEIGVAQLALDVIELQASDIADADMVGTHNDAAGTTLAPHVDARVDADRLAQPQSSLDALAMMKGLEA